jgi:arylsulfatase
MSGRAAGQPNILLVTTDQQRFDTCGASAPPFMRTPHFNDISRQGVTFNNAYADCPLCVPARMSIMTGKYATSHGMLNNNSSSTVIGRENTLPTLLREAGYQTAAIGKMHFTPERARHGFDEMILPADYYRQMQRSGNPLQPMRHGLGQNELYPTMATVPESMTLTSWIAEQCVEYIGERRDPNAPFFLWCSFSKPHPPLDPPEPYYSMYRDCEIPEPWIGDWAESGKCPWAVEYFRQSWSVDTIPPEVIRSARAAYYGLITQIDYNMGRVFAALSDIDLFKETLILYTSDHGELLGDHHSAAKIFPYEGSSHVPFALRMPMSWENRCHGAALDQMVTHADILPTLVGAGGGRIPDDVEGRDLIALARGAQKPARDFVAMTCGDFGGQRSHAGSCDGRWKYIWYPHGGVEQLFDLAEDPGECRNLAGVEGYDGILSEKRDTLIRWHAERDTGYVEAGKWKILDLPGETEADRRNRSGPGYHTENFYADIRH